jgi:hypothetical protein
VVARSTDILRTGAGVSAGVLGAVAALLACNPVFKIVERFAGPTWCEQDAQASAAYCDDFDRTPEAPQNQGIPIHGADDTPKVTSVVWSSAPNSLEVASGAVQDGGEVGRLITLPSGMPGSGMQCQVDVRVADLAAATGAGAQVGFIGLGGADNGASSAGDAGAALKLLFLGSGPSGLQLVLERIDLGALTADAAPLPLLQCIVPVPGADPQSLLGPPGNPHEWVTLTLALDPAPNDAGVLEAVCTGNGDGGKGGGNGDGGDGGVGGDAGDSGPGSSALWRVTVGAVGALVPFGDLYIPYDQLAVELGATGLVAYGLTIQGAAPATTLHVDNVRCQSP